MAKATLKPKAKPDTSRAPSNRDRAMEFSKTVRAPKRVNKPPAPPPKPQATGANAPRGRPPVKQAASRTDTSTPLQQPQLSVNTMVARHMDAARRVADIKAEVERWDLEDRELPEVPEMPKRRSPSPPRGRTKRRSPSPVRRKPAAPVAQAPERRKKNKAPETIEEPSAPAGEVPAESGEPLEQDADAAGDPRDVDAAEPDIDATEADGGVGDDLSDGNGSNT